MAEIKFMTIIKIITILVSCAFGLVGLVSAIRAYSSFDRTTDLIQNSVETWKKGPITNITINAACPEQDSIVFWNFPGTYDICDCSNINSNIA